MRRTILTMTLAALMSVGLLAACRARGPADEPRNAAREKEETMSEWDKTEQEWREILTEEEFHILREAGTEPAGTSELLGNKEDGTYVCAGCGQALFPSDTKYKSGTGWPSFYAPVESEAVATRPDRGLLGTRTEVLCSRCLGHLGHVFEDGPEPTGLRYCINGLALDFEPEE